MIWPPVLITYAVLFAVALTFMRGCHSSRHPRIRE